MGNRYLKFALNGILGTAVETIVLWVLSNFIFHNYIGNYIIAPTIAFEVELLLKFIISYYWIWNKKISRGNEHKSFISQFLQYNFFLTFGFIVRMGLLLGFEKIFGWDVIICNLVAGALSGSLNFLFAEKIVFRSVGFKQLLPQGYQWVQKRVKGWNGVIF
ncbi:GtrA family protein [Maribellus comscasis]|jgi:putative flippase GtrA|uniref:GtrA family protein n=1 Tax=Maribellus comscasis TaxID=2681766 RepID=A0A6I6JTM3_9BACT|nr:GtrA family protein [Maribellus comscasis]QGY46415.1 GtrA family protein [Maribellus comscasis]